MPHMERYEVPEIPGVPGYWPSSDAWPGILERNRAASDRWGFAVAGRSANDMRQLARRELTAAAQTWTARAGIDARPAGDAEAPIVITGHQPEIYHCGVWVKQFALEKLAKKTGASAANVIVDSDSFEDVGFWLPCKKDAEFRCRYVVAVGGRERWFSDVAAPTAERIEEIRSQASADARRFGNTVGDRFDAFLGHLWDASRSSADIAEALTKARRMHEGDWTGYMEAPIRLIASSSAFSAFVADMCYQAPRFAEIYNSELDSYRYQRRMRSKAQPFPNLAVEGARIELPLWLLGEGRRSVEVELNGGKAAMFAGDEMVAEVSPDGSGLTEALYERGLALAPKALALTLFTRVFCSDLLIHGIGGAKYDAVTDGVCRRYYGVEAPEFVVITLTMQLPSTGRETGGEDDAPALRARINRLEHNPDQALDEVELDDGQREEARELAEEKAELVRRISLPGADKKAVGARIREVNASLTRLLEPFRAALEQRLAEQERARAAADVLTERDYPYFLWSPEEVAATLS